MALPGRCDRGARTLRSVSPRDRAPFQRHLPELAGGQRILRLHPGRVRRIDALLAAAAVSVLGHDRRGGAGGCAGGRRRPDRLLHERLLLWKSQRRSLGSCVPGGLARLGAPVERRLDRARCAVFDPGAPDTALRVARRAFDPGRTSGLHALAPPARRSNGRADDRLCGVALPDRGAARRRAGDLRRHDPVAEHQRGPALVGAGRLDHPEVFAFAGRASVAAGAGAVTAGPSPGGRRWVVHWHPDEPAAAEHKDKTASGRKGCGVESQNRST